MDIALMIVSVLLILIVLLQSGKAEGAGFVTGNTNSDLFKNRKERGAELFISRATVVLGIAFFVLSIMG